MTTSGIAEHLEKDTFIYYSHTSVHFYRPQRSCGKVMFLHLSISHSVHKGVCVCIPACTGADPPTGRHIPACTGADTPRQTYPSMHWGRHPQWADICQHALGQNPPLADIRHIPACIGADTPPPDNGHCSGRYTFYWNAYL